MKKIVLITGGSSGIGLAVARQLSAQGWTICLLARDIDKLKKAKNQLEQGAECHLIQADVSQREQVVTAIRDFVREFGAPDWLITSAAIAKPDHFMRLENADFRQAMEINYFGTLFAVQAVLPAMLKRGSGAISLISSGAGFVGTYGYGAYAPTKFAVRGLAEVLRGELVSRGISVSVVCPPDTDTPQLEMENLTKPEQTRAISGHARVMSADAVASEIIAGILKKKFLISPGVEMKLLGALHSIAAPVVRWMIDRAAAKVPLEKF